MNKPNQIVPKRMSFSNVIFYLSMIFTIIGIGMKLAHYPGCNEILILAMLGMSVSTFILAIQKKTTDTGIVRWFDIGFHLMISLLIQGILFKIMHWPGCNEMLILSLMIISILYFIKGLLFGSHSKPIVNFLSSFGLSILSIAILFYVMHWPGSQAIGIIGMVSLVVVLIAYFLAEGSNRSAILGFSEKTGLVLFVLLISTLLISNNKKIKLTSGMLSEQVNSYNRMESSVEFGNKLVNEINSDFSKTNLTEDEIADLEFKIKAINEVDLLTANAIKQIDDVKLLLLQQSGESLNYSRLNDYNSLIWVKYDNKAPLLPTQINGYAILDPTDRDVPWHVLGLSNIDNRNTLAYTKLWLMLNSYRDNLVEVCGKTSADQSKFNLERNNNLSSFDDITKLLGASGKFQDEKKLTQLAIIYANLFEPEFTRDLEYNGEKVHWTNKEFKGECLLSVLNKLSNLQQRIIEDRLLAIEYIINN